MKPVNRNRRRARRSLWQNAWHAMQAVAVLSAAVGCGLFAYQVVREQEYLVAKHLEVHGTEKLQADEIMEYARVPMGASLYRVDLESIQRAVLRHPDVATALVQRVPPQTVTITITEHHPVATVAVGQGVYAVNQEGRLFRRTQAGESMDLPVITGIPRALFGEAPLQAERMVAEAVAAIRAHQAAGRPANELSEVEVDELYGVVLRLGSPVVEVVLGRGGLPGKLQRLAALEAHMEKHRQSPLRVFLDNGRYPERVAVEATFPVLAAVEQHAGTAGRR